MCEPTIFCACTFATLRFSTINFTQSAEFSTKRERESLKIILRRKIFHLNGFRVLKRLTSFSIFTSRGHSIKANLPSKKLSKGHSRESEAYLFVQLSSFSFFNRRERLSPPLFVVIPSIFSVIIFTTARSCRRLVASDISLGRRLEVVFSDDTGLSSRFRSVIYQRRYRRRRPSRLSIAASASRMAHRVLTAAPLNARV